MRLKENILLITALIVTGSCSMKESAMPHADEKAIELSATRMRVITKVGDQAEAFEDGTSFRLFAVEASAGAHDWTHTLLYDREGKEESGMIAYGEKVSYGVAPLNVIDFFGVTYGDGTPVEVSATSGSAPAVQVVADSQGVLPDLMYSDNLKAKTSASGVLNMEYHHAMAKVNFEILKQSEENDTDKKLTDAKLKKVVLSGTSLSGTFNIDTGEWEDLTPADKVVYEGSLDIGTEAQTFSTLLTIPSGEEISLRIYLDGVEGGMDYVDQTLKIDEITPLTLKQNHEYTLSIAVLKNDVRIVAVTPRVYEWIDIDLGEKEIYLGQPVYFGGLMWMDRNLGATSADCENDWYNTIGYYYQHGRNIPYILDVDVWKTHFKSKTGQHHLNFDEQSAPVKFQFPYGLVYTLDDKGRKVTDVLDLQYEFKVYEEIAINPGDVGKDYRFILGLSPNLAIASHSWAVQKTDAASNRYYYVNNDVKTTRYYYKEDPRNDTYWSSDAENQPCPKGWRLPTREDLYGFMPEYTGNMTWQSSYAKGTPLNATTSNSPDFYYSATDGNPFDRSYTWKYFAGKFDVNEDVSSAVEYSDPEPTNLGRVYGIKYEGTDKAYRVLFEQIRAKTDDDDSERLYVRVSRFNASADDVFEMNGSQWNLHKFDWSTPVEYMDFPLCGFFDSYGYIDDFGDGCIMRISDSDGEGRNWTIYLRNAYRGVSVGATSCRTLGDQIRCVRDINVK